MNYNLVKQPKFTFDQLMKMDIFTRAAALSKMSPEERLAMVGDRKSAPAPKLTEAINRTNR